MLGTMSSFSHELLWDDPLCGDRQNSTDRIEPGAMDEKVFEQEAMNESKPAATAAASSRDDSCTSNVFNSLEFGKFLTKQFPSSSFSSTGPSDSHFLSKDNVLPPFDSSVFKSKDSFSKLFATSDWEMKYNHDVKGGGAEAEEEQREQEKASAVKAPPEVVLAPLKTTSGTSPDDFIFKKNLAQSLSSRDWMPLETLGSHIDVSYSRDIFHGSDSEESDPVAKAPPAMESMPPAPPSTKTDWDSMFFSQLQLVPPSVVPTALPNPEPVEPIVTDAAAAATAAAVAAAVTAASAVDVDVDLDLEPFGVAEQEEAEEEPAMVAAAGAAADAPEVVSLTDIALFAQKESTKEAAAKAPKKRKRKPRKKVVPEVKVYVEPANTDVLLGRGGRSNHHPGNKRYREEVKNLQSWYTGIEDKDEKTDLSQCLVDYVHSYGGRFLEKDKDGWFVVPNIVARRKASQALREDNDPKKRAAKRARYLEKKAREEER